VPTKIHTRVSRRSPTASVDVIPLVARFPPLARLPRVVLGTYPTPIVALNNVAPSLWIKRDDLCADPMGGNKTRALEFLLGDLHPGERVVTVGSAGSTHALAVAVYGGQLGAHVSVGRWKQEMNATAARVEQQLAERTERAPIFRSPLGAYAWALRQRRRGARWVPAGGSSPLGILGHVNAGLELVAQIDAGMLPQPKCVVVPVGTGGTAAGIALAFRIASRDIAVVGARVVPRIVGRAQRVQRLANRTARLIEGVSGERLPRVRRDDISVAHDPYGGAYGRETGKGKEAAARLSNATGIVLDPTYSAKAFGLALELASGGPLLFWLTFDSRILGAS
jgi:1-aminocyclopropane-1-carboxylate deaminase/D-cysteine desulfhydrase-like pyridoxal-dependent ACC family enzyme